MAGKESDPSGRRRSSGLGSIFSGLTDLIEKLGELAESGEELSRHGESMEKEVKGVYGFSVKIGLGDTGIKVEPFGNTRKDGSMGESVVGGVREPLVDVFVEEDHTLIVAEMPGIGTEDVQLEVRDDVLVLEARRGETAYHKEILLPASYPREKMQVSCNNGILEIRCVL